MTFPMFESMRDKIKCSVCGTKNSGKIGKTGQPIWHKNQEKGIGFLCKNCYNIYWKQKKLQRLEEKRVRY